MLMFLLALLYDTQGPSDDGTCYAHTDADSCTHRQSVFDSTQTYCIWYPTYTGSQAGTADDCIYQNPTFSIQVILYIAVMVSLLVALCSYPIDRIFELLSAPLADDLKTADSTARRIGRRLSNAARRVSAAVNVRFNRRTVGVATRIMPTSTEAAHALASASMSVIGEPLTPTLTPTLAYILTLFNPHPLWYTYL
ncbi:hypothetical protein B484DRAFT_196934 [Ochromonadaceae sp. CCMP2298]|nr:hypothetical protein B484DRAFT_196934 [Ochromonadaceae sp. CCMP2298]